MTASQQMTVLPEKKFARVHLRARDVWTVLTVAAVCALPLVFFVPFFTEPLMRDEGLYASVAKWTLHGSIPYRDAFDNKPPMIFAYYTASFALFGENIWAPRLLVALMLCGGSVLMYIEGRLLYSHRGGLIAAVLFGFGFTIIPLDPSANTEFFMIPSLVGALVCYTMGSRTKQPSWYAASGFLSGIAIATKPVSLFILLFFMALAVRDSLRHEGRTAPALLKTVGAQAAGTAVAGVAVIAPFVATGTFGDLWEATVVYTLVYVGSVPLQEKLMLMGLIPGFAIVSFGIWVYLAGAGIAWTRRNWPNGDWLLPAGWLAANAIGIVAVGRFYNHYFAVLIPPMALLAPAGVSWLSERWQSPAVRTVTVLFIGVFGLMWVMVSLNVYLQPSADELHAAKYRERSWARAETNSAELAAWVQSRTTPEDTIWNFGFQSELYFYADRRSPTRFILDHPLGLTDQYRAEALADLQAAPPAYILDSAAYEPLDEEDEYVVEIRVWIEEHYDYLGRIYYADVFQLKESP